LIHNNSLSEPHALNLCRLSHSSIRSTLQYFLFDNIVGDDSDKLKVYVAQTKNNWGLPSLPLWSEGDH